MALVSPRLPRSLPCDGAGGGGRRRRARGTWCSAIAVDAPLASVSGIRWGSSKLQGTRSEMEDDVVLRSDGLAGFSFAAVLDGHAGFSSVEFLRFTSPCLVRFWEELYKECVLALQGGLLLTSKNFAAVRDAIQKAFEDVDAKLLTWVTIVDGRICGDLAVSRSFGDMRFKSKKNEFVPQNSPMLFFLLCRIQFKGDLVTSSPDIYQVALGSDVEFVLLASDGLWDYMKSSDAVSFVRDQLRQHGDVQLACEALARVVLVLLFPDGLLVIGHVSHFRAILIRDNIWLIITFILQDRRSQDNISIVIADLGYLSCTFLF
ncbi:hypothetical protein BHM03_00001996 [Ensete ventricosum]|uniref:protein-serine/threonine phosphatase n=1 Tax=Ensete ventricosum TaxID=4639 RepID=A0A445M9F0_ENSVE|nr:hypothetical protein BHM03_00001996 [Ensete ventricosum]